MTGPAQPTDTGPGDTAAGLLAELVELQQANAAQFQALPGRGIQLGPDFYMGPRIMLLTEAVLGPADADHPDRLRHEIAYHRQLAAMLAELESQVARSRLLQGVPVQGNGFPPGLLHGR
jgi:hypothetical protein